MPARLSLTLALSRREREQPWHIGFFSATALSTLTYLTPIVGEGFSLSQRERAGVRENCSSPSSLTNNGMLAADSIAPNGA